VELFSDSSPSVAKTRDSFRTRAPSSLQEVTSSSLHGLSRSASKTRNDVRTRAPSSVQEPTSSSLLDSSQHPRSILEGRVPPRRTRSNLDPATRPLTSCEAPAFSRSTTGAPTGRMYTRTTSFTEVVDDTKLRGAWRAASTDLANVRRKRTIETKRQSSRRTISLSEQASDSRKGPGDRTMRKTRSLDIDVTVEETGNNSHSPSRNPPMRTTNMRKDASTIQRAQLQRSLGQHDSWIAENYEYRNIQSALGGLDETKLKRIVPDAAAAPLARAGNCHVYSANTA
jgi:hypothetical protein